MKTLAEYAKANRVHDRTAWNAYKAGKIPGAYKNEFGKILGPEEDDAQTRKQEDVDCYAPVSSSMNIANSASQAQGLSDYGTAKGEQVKQVVKECASGLNDKEPKLIKILAKPEITLMVIEHRG